MPTNIGQLKIGCCGFPAARQAYAGRFNVVEVQQTFYQPPQVATLERWRAEVPAPFEFTLKAWQIITHPATSPTYRRLRRPLTPGERDECGAFQWTPIVRGAWAVTLACARALQARLVLFQCPASFGLARTHRANLRRFFSSIDRANMQLLWEPRGQWTDAEIASLCGELNLVHVVDRFVARPVTTGLSYFRLHGGKGYSHQFSHDELGWLLREVTRDRPTYVLFNNRTMFDDATRFQRLVGG